MHLRIWGRLVVGTIGFFSLVHAKAQSTGFLHASGTQIVDGRGQPFILRGMGLGGWMLQEGYMFKLSQIGQQHRIRERIQELVGARRTDQFYTAWLDNHTTRADIDALARWGFNSVRLPLHYRLFTLAVEEEPVAGRNTWLDEGIARTDSLLAWCAQNHLYLILDMHAAPGGQGHDLPISDRYPERPSLWENAANRNKLIALWKRLAQHYAGQPWIGGYDIINEPNWGFTDTTDHVGNREELNAPLRELMMSITKAIREVDRNHLIIIEGNAFGNNYKGILPAWDSNMALSFHKYGNFNTTSSVQNFLDLRAKYNVPVWMGESGENSNTWFTEAVQLVERNGIGWAWWQEKKMGINNPVEILAPDGYLALLDYWQGKGPKPSEEEAWHTLQGLIQNLRYDSNRFHPDVVDALFRQVRSQVAMPFKPNRLDKILEIDAVDYDLGAQRIAYYDLDSARYQYTPGVKTQGNRGGTYRNDGVDIENGPEGPQVFSIEAGEWLQYTLMVAQEGDYEVTVKGAQQGEGTVVLYVNGEKKAVLSMKGRSGDGLRWSDKAVIPLNKGKQQLRLGFENEGLILTKLRLVRK